MRLWGLFLGAWLVLQGLAALLNLSFRYDDVLGGALALIAGVLVILRK